MPLILIVEDEEKISDVLSLYLKNAGFDSKVVSCGSQVISWVQRNHPALILLDLNLPEKDGIEICKQVREFSDVPIIMVTARIEEIDRLIGLEFGADDYVCKPFSPREVVARVKAILKRVNKHSSSNISNNGLYIDELRQEAYIDGMKLDLTPIEFRILLSLNSPYGSVWSRDKLLTNMYNDYRQVSDRTVDSHITNLRQKMRSKRADSKCIISVYGSGYKLQI